jgi:hypothetical protein
MEIVILAVLAVLVIGAVVWPLLRRDSGDYADAREFAVGAAPPAPPPAPAGAPAGPGQPLPSDDALEVEVLRFREALVTGTLCGRCGEANPADAKYCSDCGKPLPASDTQEFAT